MADNSRKTHLAIALDNSARQRAEDAIQRLGKELPCRVTKIEGQIVTVAFEVKSPFTLPEIKMPMDTSADDWLPVQVGDKGVVRSADVYLGGVSNLGGGTADLLRRANLSALVFHPLTNKDWRPRGKDLAQDDRIVSSRNGKAALVGKNPDLPAYVDENGDLIVYGNIHCRGEIIWKFGSENTHASTHTHGQGNDSHGDTEVETEKPTAGS